MQTIGLVGGMSWESSAVYYRQLNQGVQERLGGLASARTVMVSVDLAELTQLRNDERWDDVATLLVDAARRVEAGGADFLMLCTTTFHRVAEQVEEAISIPLLDLSDVVADACRAQGVDEVGFLGTAYSMSKEYFVDRLRTNGLTVQVPAAQHHAEVDRVIYEELVHGKLVDSSRRTLVGLVDELWDAGAKGLVLGPTELELLVKQADVELPLFPATTLHVQAALDRALG